MAELDYTEEQIVATRVADENRAEFLPRFFGEYCLMGELTVQLWLAQLSTNYRGGYWHFYTLSNGGFYMAPEQQDALHLSVCGNHFDAKMSADAAGIVATLFALNELLENEGGDKFVNFYYFLRDFVGCHPEESLIYAAID